MLAIRVGRVDVYGMLDELTAEEFETWRAAAAIEGWFPLEWWKPKPKPKQSADQMRDMLAKRFG